MAAHLQHRGPNELFKGDHRRHGVAGQPESQRLSDFSEGHRLTGTDRKLPKVHIPAKFLEDRLCKIIISHRHAAGENQNVRLQPAFDASSERD